MKILYIPLDERPCNFYYPQLIASLQPDLELVVPPLPALGQKKHPADIDALWRWIEGQVMGCEFALLSIDMLVYGGLLPSRLHQDSVEVLRERLHRIRVLQLNNPGLEIFASSLIMRTPAYNSSEEEPDYYEQFGKAIFQWGWFEDKQARRGLTAEETAEFERVQRHVPAVHLEDYRQRRRRNLAVNVEAIALVKAGIISFLSIPQDDCAQYGFTTLDQQQVVRTLIEQHLQQHIHFYPGADEVGCTLLARACSQHQGRRCKIYPFYSAVAADSIVPLYEDRPLGESLKSHILAVGAQVVSTPQDADFILAVNTPGKVMQEAWDNPIKDLTYTTCRNLPFFVDRIATFLGEGKQVAIADVAFANGGETELVQLLDDARAWDQLLAYAGWNTSCNTIGTVLATAIVAIGDRPKRNSTGKAFSLENRIAIDRNKIYHLLDGWAYQTVVRMDMVKTYLPTLGASYYNFNHYEAQINQEMERRIRAAWSELIRHSFAQRHLQMSVFSPWHRMFEIGLDLTI